MPGGKPVGNPFGTVNAPPGVANFPGGGNIAGIPVFINILLQTLIVGAGVYALFNIVLAGYSFISAGGDSKKIEASWARIWQGILGLAIAGGSFVIAAIIGQLLFGDAGAIINFRIIGL